MRKYYIDNIRWVTVLLVVVLTSRNFTTQKCSEPRTSRFSLVLCSILIAAHKVI